MAKTPKVGTYLDDEEKKLIEIIEGEDYEIGKSFMTPERLEELQAAAKATINEERVKVSIRVPKTDLLRLKAQAMREGMPYQTLINSILHKAVDG